jgi:hypothetical protein
METEVCVQHNDAETVEKTGQTTGQSWREYMKAYMRQYRQKNPERIAAARRRHYLQHREDAKEAARVYYEQNKDRIKKRVNAYTEKRMKNDHAFCVRRRLRMRLRTALKTSLEGRKIKKSSEYGIDYEKIFQHLGPCPGALSDYHIDHIRPLCLFDFNDPEQIRAAFAPENHQWLRKEENLAKHCKTTVVDNCGTKGERE